MVAVAPMEVALPEKLAPAAEVWVAVPAERQVQVVLDLWVALEVLVAVAQILMAATAGQVGVAMQVVILEAMVAMVEMEFPVAAEHDDLVDALVWAVTGLVGGKDRTLWGFS